MSESQDARGLIASIMLRSCYGGMKGDIRFLRAFAQTAELVRRAITADQIWPAIWHHRSGVNYKRPVYLGRQARLMMMMMKMRSIRPVTSLCPPKQ